MNTYYRNTRAFSRTVGIWIALLVSLCSQAQEMPYISGEFIVRLVPGSNLQDLQGELEGMWGSPVSFTSLSRSTHIHKLSVTSVVFDQADEGRSMLQDLQANDLLELAQFNHIVSERETVPNDPDFGVQWHHQETGDHDIDSDLAWDITTGGTTAAGDDIVVCVIEGGGTNYNHTDLVGNHWTNTGEIPANGIDDDENGYVDDYNGWNPGSDDDNIPAGGHGTSVSGMIGATGNNSQGGSGVNWAVKIMQVVVGTLTEANVIAAYDYPLSMRQLYNLTAGEKGAFVVATNASWGIDFANPVNYPVWCGFYDDLGAAGILNCGATTNNNVNVDALGDMPTACSSPYMVAVTATDVNDVRTFSGYGASTIDLGAPGESVYLPAGSTNYGYTSGTSFASPCVAGAIALMYSAPCSDFAAFAISTPQWTADQALSYLLNGVDPVANLATETVTGGRLNVRNSIDLLLANCGPPPTCTLDSLQAVALCTYDENTGAVVAAAELSLQFNFGFCEVSELCYTPAGGS